VKIFIDHVEQYYDDILGFEKKVEESKDELYSLDIQRLARLNIFSAQPHVGGALMRSLNRGLGVKQANLSEMHPDIFRPFFLRNNSCGGST
jgi:hypothetical protein